jgi:hypothetical protein
VLCGVWVVVLGVMWCMGGGLGCYVVDGVRCHGWPRGFIEI